MHIDRKTKGLVNSAICAKRIRVMVNELTNLNEEIKSCAKFTNSVAEYISFSSMGLEGMIEAVYGAPNPSSMLNLYENATECRKHLPRWTSQLGQDSLVASLLDMKTSGYFIEIGCGNGTIISNTYSLETFLGWDGLLVEPNPVFCEDMRRTRKSLVVESAITAGVDTQELTLIQGNVYGSCQATAHQGPHSEFLSACNNLGLSIKVNTIEPKTLCQKYNVPKLFDYLSIDIEGNELQVLLNWPFSTHRPLILSIEHNYGPDRNAIRAHMTKCGYSVFGIDWEDIFVYNQLLEEQDSTSSSDQIFKMNHQEPPGSANDTSSIPCYKSLLLATNWALRDQFLIEIQRIKDDSYKMIAQANERIETLEASLGSVMHQESLRPEKASRRSSIIRRIYEKIKGFGK
jgi:FkbM family methyltransferase